jgi:hypothetical protein
LVWNQSPQSRHHGRISAANQRMNLAERGMGRFVGASGAFIFSAGTRSDMTAPAQTRFREIAV